MRDPESTNIFFHRELTYTEQSVWKAHYQWLREQGYQLRERYSPDWKPTWTERHTEVKDDEPLSEEVMNRFGLPLLSQVVDAIRISDGRQVVIKRVNTPSAPTELELTAYFSPYGYGYDLRGKRQYNLDPSDADCARIKSDPRNHCPELLDVLYPPQEMSNDEPNGNVNANADPKASPKADPSADPNDDPELIFLVFPLYRKALSPRFDTIGEIVDFCRQLFEAVEFLHEHGVAHRDIHINNIMYDPSPMFPEPYHPVAPFRTLTGHHIKYHTRTVAPPTYILIDLGHGVHRSGAAPGMPLLTPKFTRPADKSVPELVYSSEEERVMEEGSEEERLELYKKVVDPFMTDVYCVGNVIRQVVDEVS
ncbi:hypothetical protein CVT24_008663 [Panaeolus cyanescens]|uniref:Protein kinase domain-containing protein n=1 Tax=Panaeolus cyanescens TaxID=181874 RepID=A0A409WWM5_9AGAR|nr:hypothetical protein CVT24_008663 [Panaeolus cyanescens]